MMMCHKWAFFMTKIISEIDYSPNEACPVSSYDTYCTTTVLQRKKALKIP
jgi:hypothetical protein